MSTESGVTSSRPRRRAYSSNSARLRPSHLKDALVHAFLRKEAVESTDAPGPGGQRGDRLCLDGRVPLRLGDDDDRCGLDVEADSARLDLCSQGPMEHSPGSEFIDEALPLRRWHVARDRADCRLTQRRGDRSKNVAEE